MTKEQTVLQIVKLIQGGKGYLTKEGEEKLDRMIQQHLTKEDTFKEHTIVRSVPTKTKKRYLYHPIKF